MDLPLWGRFPVVVITYDVEEKSKENGQCSVSMTLTRAGITIEERTAAEDAFDAEGKAEAAAKLLEEAAVQIFEETLEEDVDTNTLVSVFAQLKGVLLGIIGRVQGAKSTLNRMTNAVTRITNLIAQGIRAPRELAGALFGAAASIVSGVMEIKNTWDDTVSYFKNVGNLKKMMIGFFCAGKFTADADVVTLKQHITKDSTENLYRTVALAAAGQLLAQAEMTYQEAGAFFALYETLEASVNQNDPDMYRAVRDMRLAVSMALSARKLDAELMRDISLPVPILYLAHILGCDDAKIRQLNTVADSFVIRGDVIYV
jgi:hypothetical protein